MNAIEIIRPGELLSCDPQGAALAHGFGLFETLRVESGNLYFWEAHWARLCASAGRLGIPVPADADAVFAAIGELVREVAPGDRLTVKVSLLREVGGSRLVVYSRPAYPAPERVGLLCDADYPIYEGGLLAGHKTHNYMENRLLMDLAREQGCYDVARLNTREVIAEGALSNIFWARDGVLFTPAGSTGLLPGTVRAALLEAVRIEQGSYRLEHLLEAESVFLTNSSCGVLPVDWLRRGREDRALNSASSPAYATLMHAFEASVVACMRRL
jgi:branched-subunit amino acid aminotransferase/4-amino-4-deoxychorismate lyase